MPCYSSLFLLVADFLNSACITMSFQVEMAGTQARDREENPLVPAITAGYTVAAVALGIAEGGVGGAVAEEGVAEVREVAIVTMALGMEVVVGEAGGGGHPIYPGGTHRRALGSPAR